MFLLLRLFNSVVFVIVNSIVALYTLQRFFRAMRTHNQLVDEFEEYNSLVEQSRRSLDFVSEKVMEAMREMEHDIGQEVDVTHHLTELSSEVAAVSQRFNHVEDQIIQLARLNNNMENATAETPMDINDEVRKVMVELKSRSAPIDSARPRKSARARSSRTASRSSYGPQQQQQQQQAHKQRPVSGHKRLSRSRSPIVLPEVTLLHEQRQAEPAAKPIGFRPPWMFEV